MNPDLTAGGSSAMEILKVFLQRVEKTCKQVAAIQAAGTAAEKRRAAAALVAFSRATGLVKELGQLRFKMAEETSAPTKR
jgi:hypothetical protein